MSTNEFVKTKPLIGANISQNTEDAKLWLDSISPSMCLAKWFHVSLHLTNGRTHSCYHPPTHSIDIQEIKNNPKALHNTLQKKEERKDMVAGRRPKGCSYCWKIEDAPNAIPDGNRSDRHYRSGEFWAAPYKDLSQQLSWDKDVNPTYVEVNFNQACNFKCSYCSPHLSSEWQKEIEKFGAYPTRTKHNDIGYLESTGLMPIKGGKINNPFVEAFWQWWPEMYKTLHMFRMTGGEPLLDNNTYKILDYVSLNPKGDLEISITSNMCPPDPSLMDRFINSLQKIQDYQIEVFVLIDNAAEVPKIFVIEKESLPLDALRRLGFQNNEAITLQKAEHCLMGELESKEDKKRFIKKSFLETKACKHFSLYVSIDAWGSRAEYIRHGMVFNNLLSNVKRVLYETHFTTITFINTFNLFSVSSFIDFLQGILDLRRYVHSLKDVEGKNPPLNNYWGRQRVWFDIPVLRFPEWQSIQNLPTEFQAHLISCIKFMEENHVSQLGDLIGFNDYEIEKAKRNLNWMASGEQIPSEDMLNRKEDFYRFFTEHDRRRNTNLTTVFPELNNFYENCKEVANVRSLQKNPSN